MTFTRSLAGLLLLLATVAGSAAAAPGEGFLAKGRQALAQGDGIAAEVELRRALATGASRASLAAWMGEALLDQAQPEKAREWLEPGEFTPDSAAWGFRQLAKLEREEGDLAAAGRALDRALILTPRDATMWVEIGRLRYAGGEHLLALEAADHALELDRANIRALEFKGQFVRDQSGLVAALPWFERALSLAPRDMDLLGEYAATLCDIGRARDCLAATRKILAIEGGNPKAYFIQSVLAARAGKVELARGLLARTKGKLDTLPAVQLLEGVLEMGAGNYGLAADALAKLERVQPGNSRVQVLLARAYALSGEHKLVLHDYEEAAARPDASPYMLALIGRAHEAEGRRDLAAPFLDRAAFARRPDFWAAPLGSEAGGLLAAGSANEAARIAEADLSERPGSVLDLAVFGDVLLAAGDAAGALEKYRAAAHIRLTDSLMLRMMRAGESAALYQTRLSANPANRIAMRLASEAAARAGDWRRARLLLENLRANGTDADAELLGALALAQLRTGDTAAAEATASRAYELQRSSPIAAEAWGLVLEAIGRKNEAAPFLDKSRRILHRL